MQFTSKDLLLLLIFSGVALCSLNGSGDGSPMASRTSHRQVLMRSRGMISPIEAVDFIHYLPEKINDMDFSRCDATVIEKIKEHLNPVGRALFEEKLSQEAKRKAPLRKRWSTDGTSGQAFSVPPRMAAGNGMRVGVDEEWNRQQRWRQPHSNITPMVVGGGPQWNYQKAFFQQSPLGAHADASDSSHEESDDGGGSSGEWQLSQLTDGAAGLKELQSRSAQANAESKAVSTPKDPQPKVHYNAVNSSSDSISSSSLSEDEEEAEQLRAFFKRGGSQYTNPNSVWYPPSEPRLRKKSNQQDTAAVRRRTSQEELLINGFRQVGRERYVSPTRPKAAQRKVISRESSAGRLSRETILRQASAVQPSARYRGILNDDNLCYLISVIQALFHLPGVAEAVTHADTIKQSRREAFGALRRLFDTLGRFVDRPQGERVLTPVAFGPEDIKLLASGTHEGQGDASEAFLRLLSIAGYVLKPMFSAQMQEVILEDRPAGFVFSDHWLRTRSIQYNVLDYDFRSLQEYVDYGLAASVSLQLDPKADARHQLYLDSLEDEIPNSLPAVKYSNIIQPGDLICFHLVRYAAHATGHSPRLAAMQVEYPEELKIVGQVYRLQSVIVHESWTGNINAGHYYTIARTEHEEWVEFNDARATIIGKTHALSKTSTATLLFYSRRQDDEADLVAAALASGQADLSGLPFILRDRAGTNLLRAAISDAMPFAHDFRMQSFQRPICLLYQSKGYSKASIRQALKIYPGGGPEMEPLLKTLERERRSLATERLLEDFPQHLSEIADALDRHQGSYQEALLDLKAKLS